MGTWPAALNLPDSQVEAFYKPLPLLTDALFLHAD